MRACFVCHSARGLVGGNTGGAERQVALLARSLAARGHETSLVVPGYDGPAEIVDGVRLVSGWLPDKGRRVLRMLTYRARELRRVLREQAADVYYVRGRPYFAPIVLQTARREGATALLGLANDRDLSRDASRLPYGVAEGPLARPASWLDQLVWDRTAVRAADWIVTQHVGQNAVCAALGLRHVLIPNVVDHPSPAIGDVPLRYDAVWIGNVQREDRARKGLDELVELTRALPELRFAVAGRLSAAAASLALAQLEAADNVDVLGALAHEDALAVVAASRVVINTSAWEGLSNVMLEGWALGRPSVTLRVDPNGLLGDGELGRCGGGDMAAMKRELLALVSDGAELAAAGARARGYVARTHGAAAVCEAYELLLGAPAPAAGGVS